jgi:hypothetical protein
MPATFAKQPSALERLNAAAPCRQSAKADLQPHTPACDMREPAKEALKRTAKQEAAAEAAGITQSRRSHKFAEGSLTLAQMEAFGPDFAAELGRQLVEIYAPLATPKTRAAQIIRNIHRELDELSQAVEAL